MLLIACAIGCKPDSPGSQLSSQSEPKSPITVNVIQPGPSELAVKTATYFGTVEPNRKLTLGFTVGGTLKSSSQVRQTVTNNQVIAELDSSELTTRRDSAKSEMESLISQFGESANTESLRNQIEELDRQIRRHRIIAPFDCTVEKVFATKNSLVGSNAPVVSIVETGKPRIEVCFPRRISNRLNTGYEVVFTLDGQLINGRLTNKSLTEDPPGNIKAWFEVITDLSDIPYVFGQTVEGTFVFDLDVKGHWIPLTSIRHSSEGLWSVFKVEQAGEQMNVRQKLVEVHQIRDDAAFVIDDLSETLVVLDGVHRIVSGQQVRINRVQLESADTATGTAQ